jgi:hypothetical protein
MNPEPPITATCFQLGVGHRLDRLSSRDERLLDREVVPLSETTGDVHVAVCE